MVISQSEFSSFQIEKTQIFGDNRIYISEDTSRFELDSQQVFCDGRYDL